MLFDLYSTKSFSGLLGTFDSLSTATTSINKYRSIDIRYNGGTLDPLIFDRNYLAVRINFDGAKMFLDNSVNNFRLDGIGATTIYTSNTGGRIWGNDGNNTLIGNDARDILYGGNGDDSLIGGAGDDVLKGGRGVDVLIAGAGSDKLYGGKGADTLLASEGTNQLYGGKGGDVFNVSFGSTQKTYIRDFSIQSGDTIEISGIAGVTDFASLLSVARVYQARGHTMIKFGDSFIQIRDFNMADLTAAIVTVVDAPFSGSFASFADFLASGLAGSLTEVDINGTIYRARDGEPLHQNYKYQDDGGGWWSPDYFVVVAAGQSNMVGAGSGADISMNGNVVAYDWVNGVLTLADYSSAPAGGVGVRTGTSIKNNLYFPLANRLAEELDQPILVIARPVNGSRIDSWLETGTNASPGVLWADLVGDINAALTTIGQNSVDLFGWLQGESDFPMAQAVYKLKFLAFLDQIRASGWSDEKTAILIGELSREGVNFVQNRALQEIELAENDPNLAFVSSTGLTSFDLTGIHFDGQSLYEYGYQRFFAEYLKILQERAAPGSSTTPNTAPELNVAVAPPAALTLAEGEEIRLNVADFFTDAEGDNLYYYSFLSKRTVFLATTDGNEIVIRPDFAAAGQYDLTIYASDYYLDGASFTVSLTVTDNTPLILAYSNKDFALELGGYLTFDRAQEALKSNRGIDILDPSALSTTGDNLVTIDALHIRGDAGITGNFVLAGGVLRGYLYGTADFGYTGNLLNNTLTGNAGDNQLTGLEGADRIYGHIGIDFLFGGAGNDRLYGGNGNDFLDAGDGNDQLWGGNGADIFVFANGTGKTQIRDFSTAQGDLIEVSGLSGITNFTEFMSAATIRDSIGRVIVDISGNTLILYDITAADIDAGMFNFI